MNRKSAMKLAARICDVFLWTGNDAETEDVYDEATDFIFRMPVDPSPYNTTQIGLAIPGNAGCFNNRLIKMAWHLCDCKKDIERTVEFLWSEKKEVYGSGK